MKRVFLGVVGGAWFLAGCSGGSYDENVGAAQSATSCQGSQIFPVNIYDGSTGMTKSLVADRKGAVGFWTDTPTIANAGFNCSGTLIGTNLFLTAGHCVTLTDPANTYVSFNYEWTAGTDSPILPTQTYKVSSIVAYQDTATLDFGLARLEGDPGATWGWTDIRESSLATNDLVGIIQHPDLEPSWFGTGHVQSQSSNELFYADLSTGNGSSGSGILDKNGLLVGVHTDGGCLEDGGGANHGQRMTKLLASSPDLLAASRGSSWTQNLGFCTQSGASLLVGDFNGDKLNDLLCRSGQTLSIARANSSGQFPSVTSTNTLAWCTQSGARTYVGDFNGDGRHDLLCRDATGSTSVAFANTSGQFSGASWTATLAWCNQAGASLTVGDFNGDKRDDLLCRDATGYTSVALASSSGQFSASNWSTTLSWCVQSGAKLLVLDLNGDGRKDMLCRDGTGYTSGVRADSSGHFGAPNFTSTINWCKSSSAKLLAGDFNGDGREDVFCRDSSHKASIAYATTNGDISPTTWTSALTWCTQSSARVFTARFNGDTRSDVLCADTNGLLSIDNGRRDGTL